MIGCCTVWQLEDSNPSAKQLLALSRVINQSVGDALSCVLAVELALRCAFGALLNALR
jgi:hypothetical protein